MRGYPQTVTPGLLGFIKRLICPRECGLQVIGWSTQFRYAQTDGEPKLFLGKIDCAGTHRFKNSFPKNGSSLAIGTRKHHTEFFAPQAA